MTKFSNLSTLQLRRCTISAFAGLLLFIVTVAANGADMVPLKICLLSGSSEYESDKSLAGFQAYLEKHYQVTCQRAFGKDKGEDLPGLEALTNSDLMVVFTRRIKLPPNQLELVQNYIASGRPIIGIRTASHAFENYKEFDREILGGGYKGHYADEPAQVKPAAGRKDHPILAGVIPFATRKLYKNPLIADSSAVLLTASMPNYEEPVAWIREYKGGRVFYTSLGTPEDFSDESFRRLLVNAIFWTTKTDEAASRRSQSGAGKPAP